MISLIDYDLVEEAYFTRVVMEKAIVDLACEKMTEADFVRLDENLMLQEFYLDYSQPFKLLELDNEFHMLLFQACNKRQCYEMVRSISLHFDRVRSLSVKAFRDTGRVEEHRAIAKAIKEIKETSIIIMGTVGKIVKPIIDNNRGYEIFVLYIFIISFNN